MGEKKLNIFPCNWKECNNNKDWCYVGCIGRKVNIYKLAKKKHLDLVQIFMSCPYCGGRVVLK